MSSWVKIDKDLPGSTRFKRLLKAYRDVRGDVTERNALQAERDVTTVLGALVRLWIYADSHIDENNQLIATKEELGELVGIDGFADMMPPHWLLVIDEDHIELPDFIERNGPSSKERSSGAERQARYRKNLKERSESGGVTRNGDVTPSRNASRQTDRQTDKTDQTRIARDVTGGTGIEPVEPSRTDRKLRPSATEPADTWESHRQWALDTLRPAYPSNLNTEADWQIAVRTIAGRLEVAETTREELLQLTQDFAAQQDAKGNRNTQYVENPVRHFDGRGKWKGPFRLPAAQQKPDKPKHRYRTADEIEAEERSRAAS